MSNIDYIKGEIERLYKTDPNVHVSVRLTHPRVEVENSPARIVGVYRNIFQIEENNRGTVSRHTFQYGEVLIGHVIILELDYLPMVSILDKKQSK